MHDGLLWHRIQFAFTSSFHYLFPQLTMGLALFIVVFKVAGMVKGDERYLECARFWGRIFGINFVVGVVTGIPLEFQFGTNWARFSNYAGGVIGQTLAMEGMFAFFLESTFLGLFLFGEKRLGPRKHLAATVAVFLGAWLSGYFIIATNAFMQNPVGYEAGPDGSGLQLAGFWDFVLNRWALWQYAHNMMASVVTSAFVIVSIGAYWALMGQHEAHARICLRTGVIGGLIASILVIFPTGDAQGKLVAANQKPTLAAMEGLFEGTPNKEGSPADLAIIGQPNVKEGKLENPIFVPRAVSFLAYGTFGSKVKGLNDFREDERPTNIEFLYYCYHIMAGLGTIFVALLLLAGVQLVRGKLHTSRKILWLLMLAAPFPYIATTAGWCTAELGRQPWVVYRLMRTVDASSTSVNTGNVVFTLIGFIGLYLLLGLLFVFLIFREVSQGPVRAGSVSDGP